MERQYCGLYKLFYCCYFMSFSCLMSCPQSLFQALNAYILECEEWAHRVYRLESARLFLQSSKLASPIPSPASGFCFPLWFREGTQSLALVLSLSTMHGPTQSHQTVPLSKCRNAGNNVSPVSAFYLVVICINLASAFPN
jgi:hypothetical protein